MKKVGVKPARLLAFPKQNDIITRDSRAEYGSKQDSCRRNRRYTARSRIALEKPEKNPMETWRKSAD